MRKNGPQVNRRGGASMARSRCDGEGRRTEMAMQCVFQGGWMDVEDVARMEGTSKGLRAQAETWWKEMEEVVVDKTSVQTLHVVKTIAKKCKNLKKLEFRRVSRLEETYMQQCVQPNVQSLTITMSRKLTGKTLHAMLRDLEQLELLDISGCTKITHMDVERCLQLPSLRKLKVLRVVDLPINTWTMGHLPLLCPELQELDAGCSSLNFLVGENGSAWDDVVLEERRKILSGVEGKSKLRPRSFDLTVDHSEREWGVEKLCLSHRGMYEVDLIGGYPRCPNLTELDLSYNDIGSEVVFEIARQCNKLRVLKLSASHLFEKRLTDESLQAISQNLPELVELHLHQQEVVTGHGLQCLAMLQKLKLVVISRNNRITTDSVLSLVQDCKPDLRLVLVGCKRVSKKVEHRSILFR